MSMVNAKTIDALKSLAEKGKNVLLTGTHGIGKTVIVKKIARELRIKTKYYSASTLDPWADLVGVPSPKRDPESFQIVTQLIKIGEDVASRFIQKNWMMDEADAKQVIEYVKKKPADSLDFLRPEDLEGAQWVVFDEINRSHPKVQNAVLEMVQFKSINGKKIKSLKMVWAMQNPPGGAYKTTELDPALVTRFHAHIMLEGRPSSEYFIQQGIKKQTAEAVVAWYSTDLNEQQKQEVPPRVLQHICELVDEGHDIEFCLLNTMKVPSKLMKNRLNDTNSHQFAGTSLSRIAKHVHEYSQHARTNADFAKYFVAQLLNKRLRVSSVLQVVPVMTALPAEYQRQLFSNGSWVSKLYKVMFKKAHKLSSSITNQPGYNDFRQAINEACPHESK